MISVFPCGVKINVSESILLLRSPRLHILPDLRWLESFLISTCFCVSRISGNRTEVTFVRQGFEVTSLSHACRKMYSFVESSSPQSLCMPALAWAVWSCVISNPLFVARLTSFTTEMSSVNKASQTYYSRQCTRYLIVEASQVHLLGDVALKFTAS